MANNSYIIKTGSLTIKPKASAPTGANKGDFYVDSGDSVGLLQSYNGASWIKYLNETASQTLTNKTINSSNNTLTIDGDECTVRDLALTSLKTNLSDASKFLVRDASGIAVSDSKAVPTGVVVGTTDSQTLTNKTLTSPIIATIVNSGTLTLPTSTDTLIGRATTDTLTNKTLTSPIIAQISNTGVLTLPTSTDTLVGRATTDTLTNKTITNGSLVDPTINEINVSGGGVLSFPTVTTDVLVAVQATQTLTNKTLTSPVLTVPTINIANLTDQGSDPSSPSAGSTKLYSKTDGNIYSKVSSGAITQLGGVAPFGLTAIKVANYTILSTDNVIRVGTSGSAWNLTLPTASTVTGKVFDIINTDSSYTGFAISIVGTIRGGNGAETDWKIHTPNERYRIISNGTDYNLLDHQTSSDPSANALIAIGAISFNPTKGTTTADHVFWYREGRFANFNYTYFQSGAGVAGTGNYLISLPDSLAIDTSYQNTDSSTVAIYLTLSKALAPSGFILNSTSGSSSLEARAAMYSSTQFRIMGISDATNASTWGSTYITLANTNITITGWLKVPISGWKD